MRFWIPICLCLSACPEAPSDLEYAGGSPEEGGAAGAPGPGFEIANTGQDDPAFSQEELAEDPEAVTLDGLLTCETGGGPFRIRVFVPPPEEGGPVEESTGTPPGPLALVEIAAPGPFRVLVPRSGALKILAFEDADENGFATPEEAQFQSEAVIDASANVSGLALDCANVMASPAPLPAALPSPEGDAGAGDAPGAVPGEAPAVDGPPPLPPPEPPPAPPEGAEEIQVPGEGG